MIMALLVSAVCAIFVGGLATPRAHVASRAIVLTAAPETVWQLVRDVKNYPDWRDDVYSVHIDSGSVDEMRWTELGSGSLSYVAVTDEAPTRFAARIADQDLSYSSEWRYVLSPEGTGTRLVISDHGEVGNPMFRFFRTHFIGFTGNIDKYLSNLAVQLREHAKPQPVVT
jgi:hypothetical protein